MYKAKSIIDNKFWILESEDGSRIGTIKMQSDKVRVVIGKDEHDFADMNSAIGELDLTFPKKMSDKHAVTNEVYGFPTSTRPYNALWNVQLKLPIYTKTAKSNSYHCAGYYIIRFGSGWVKSYCPKLITLQRYEHRGPFMSKIEMQDQLRIANETT